MVKKKLNNLASLRLDAFRVGDVWTFFVGGKIED
jgi:hypothetical protein